MVGVGCAVICTWADCKAPAVVPQLDRGGKEWARLCVDHDRQLEAAIGGPVKEMLRAWIKAKGGVKRAVKKI